MGRSKVRISVDGAFFVALSAAILLLPLKWLLCASFAAFIHELSHFLALRLSGVEVRSIRIGAGGAMMSTAPMSARQEALCAAAGPLGGGMLILSAPLCPSLALCAFVQTGFNLLPIFPLDGGRVVRAFAFCILPPTVAGRFCRILQFAALGAMIVLAIRFATELGSCIVGFLPL